MLILIGLSFFFIFKDNFNLSEDLKDVENLVRKRRKNMEIIYPLN